MLHSDTKRQRECPIAENVWKIKSDEGPQLLKTAAAKVSTPEVSTTKVSATKASIAEAAIK